MAADKARVDLRGAAQTMLATLYAKALDAGLPEPILGDHYAVAVVDRIDYDWRKTTITARRSPSVTTRAAHFESDTFGRLPRPYRALGALMPTVPALVNMAQYHRYAF